MSHSIYYYAECHYAVSSYADAIMLRVAFYYADVIMLCLVTLSVIMLCLVTRNVIMLGVIMLSVVAPILRP